MTERRMVNVRRGLIKTKITIRDASLRPQIEALRVLNTYTPLWQGQRKKANLFPLLCYQKVAVSDVRGQLTVGGDTGQLPVNAFSSPSAKSPGEWKGKQKNTPKTRFLNSIHIETQPWIYVAAKKFTGASFGRSLDQKSDLTYFKVWLVSCATLTEWSKLVNLWFFEKLHHVEGWSEKAITPFSQALITYPLLAERRRVWMSPQSHTQYHI